MNYIKLWSSYCQNLNGYIYMQQNKQRLYYEELLAESTKLDEMILLLNRQPGGGSQRIWDEVERRRARLGQQFEEYSKRKAWLEGLEYNFDYLQQSLNQMPDSTVG